MMKKALCIPVILLICILPLTAFGQGSPATLTPAPGTPAWPWWSSWNPYNPNFPYPNTNPYRRAADSATYGQVTGYVEVPPQQVVILVYVPGPGSFSGEYEPQVIEIPGYVVTETSTGYIYPPRWGVQQVTPGVHQWVALPQQFQPK